MNRHPSAGIAGFVVAASLVAVIPNAWAQAPPIDGASSDPPQSQEMRPPAQVRFKRFVAAAAGPAVLVETVGWAAIAQVRDTPTEWRQDAKGYGQRFASLMGQGAVQESVTYGLSEAMKVDSSFHRSRKHGFFPRAGDAMMQAVASRRLDGHRVVSAPLLTGYTAGGMAMLSWYPGHYGYRDGFRYAGLALAVRGGFNLIREFVPSR